MLLTLQAVITTPPQPIQTPFGLEQPPVGAASTVLSQTIALTFDAAAVAALASMLPSTTAGAPLTAQQLAATYTAAQLVAALTILETAG